MRPVRLTQTGGSGGTDTTPATWTYTAHDAGTGTLVRENVRYAGYRPVGMMLPATYGLYRDGQIHWCDEALPGAYGEFTTITETELTRRTVITGVDCNPDGTITVHPTEFGGHWVYPPRA